MGERPSRHTHQDPPHSILSILSAPAAFLTCMYIFTLYMYTTLSWRCWLGWQGWSGCRDIYIYIYIIYMLASYWLHIGYLAWCCHALCPCKLEDYFPKYIYIDMSKLVQIVQNVKICQTYLIFHFGRPKLIIFLKIPICLGFHKK